tara:strand:+ start:1526 stop:1789 length:264 start_codon:yes stop_codon:yes gene_type:complete
MTSAILFPTNIVVIKSDSFLEKYAIIEDGNLPVLLSNSSCNLLDETKAISMPEKKAENKSVMNAIKNIYKNINFLIKKIYLDFHESY